MSTDGLFYQYTYGYKTPDQVRNKTPNLSDPNWNINEGGGGFNDYYCMIVSTNPAAIFILSFQCIHELSPHTQQEEIYPRILQRIDYGFRVEKIGFNIPHERETICSWNISKNLVMLSNAFWIVNPYENKFYDKSNWSVNPTKMEDEHLCSIALTQGPQWEQVGHM